MSLRSLPTQTSLEFCGQEDTHCLCLLMAPQDVASATKQQKCISRVALQQGPTDL